MRFRHVAVFGVLGAFACAAAGACIPELITDPADAAPLESSSGFDASCGNTVIDTNEQCDPSRAEVDGSTDSGVIGCTTDCRVLCDEDGGVIDPLTNHCYFKIASATSLDDPTIGARQACKSHSAHVVTFADDRERNFVINSFPRALQLGDASAFWVGLTLVPATAAMIPIDLDQTKEPGWSPTCSGCYAPSDVDGAIPRLIFDAGGSCIVDVAAFGWSQFPCTQIPFGIPVVCEREPVGEVWQACNGGLCARIVETAFAKRYLFAPIAVSAQEAERACGDLGGSLVTFESRQERETLLRSLIRHYEAVAIDDPSAPVPGEVWIGYELAADAGRSFVWDGDGGFDGSPWGNNEPVTRPAPVRAYAGLNTDAFDVQLAHDDTDVPRPYICQY